jgi:hypothetical protein
MQLARLASASQHGKAMPDGSQRSQHAETPGSVPKNENPSPHPMGAGEGVRGNQPQPERKSGELPDVRICRLHGPTNTTSIPLPTNPLIVRD